MNQEQYSDIEKEKLKFGIQIILSEFTKLLLIYLVAFLLDCIVPTSITHLTFFLLRQVCLGYHFKNLYICLSWSTIAFPIAVNYLADLYLNFSITFLYIVTSVLLLVVYKLAPKGTENQPIISQKHQSHLRKKMTIRLLLIVGVFCFSPLEVKVFIAYGVFLETIMLIAQTIKERIINE